MVVDTNFMTLNILKLDFYFILLVCHSTLEGIITKINKKII